VVLRSHVVLQMDVLMEVLLKRLQTVIERMVGQAPTGVVKLPL
jgi:hypothetical protein